MGAPVLAAWLSSRYSTLLEAEGKPQALPDLVLVVRGQRAHMMNDVGRLQRRHDRLEGRWPLQARLLPVSEHIVELAGSGSELRSNSRDDQIGLRSMVEPATDHDSRPYFRSREVAKGERDKNDVTALVRHRAPASYRRRHPRHCPRCD